MSKLKYLLYQVKSYLRFYKKAKTIYQIHSPFAFEFVRDVIEDKRRFYPFDEVEGLRASMLKSSQRVHVTDYGAGSQIDDRNSRALADIVKYSATTPVYCRYLFKIIDKYKPEKMLELGTSVGISSLYQSAASLNGTLVTLEGCPNIAAIAAHNFKIFKRKNIVQMVGKFESQLPKALDSLGRVDYVFFDGNHQEKPTLAYFEQCLQYAHEDTVFVFDDIHWSSGMEHAWTKIKQHEKVKLTIDLYYCGVVFFKKEILIKEHFAIIQAKRKPWRIGLFG